MARISLALSGGGHRASLFALGALLYLVDSAKNREVSSIASVSGGSLTNAYVAQEIDFAQADPQSFRSAVRPLARLLATRGSLFAAPLTKAYLVSLLIVVLAGLVLPWAVGPAWARPALVVGGLILIGVVAQWRGWVCSQAFRALLFSSDGRPTKLSDTARTPDHVLCATDLHAGEHVYFSGRFVCSYRFGWGSPGELNLHDAVQASAALPGAFPPRWFATGRHSFVDPAAGDGATTTHMVLADGGVYDNMGDQWGQGVEKRNERWEAHDPDLAIPEELVVVNASAAMGFKPTGRMRIPLIGEVLALLRDKSILYDNGTSVRRQALVARFDLAAREGDGIRGALVHIPQSPLRAARAFLQSAAWPERSQRAQAVIALLKDQERQWEKIALENTAVKTTLSKLGPDVSARLMYHGYVLAMANLHVILGYPLLEIPREAVFMALVSDGSAPGGRSTDAT